MYPCDSFVIKLYFLFTVILGLTGSVVLRSGRLSDLIAQLQELLKGVDEAEISPGRLDTAVIAAQVWQTSECYLLFGSFSIYNRLCHKHLRRYVLWGD